jgi:hypothetical protein
MESRFHSLPERSCGGKPHLFNGFEQQKDITGDTNMRTHGFTAVYEEIPTFRGGGSIGSISAGSSFFRDLACAGCVRDPRVEPRVRRWRRCTGSVN